MRLAYEVGLVCPQNAPQLPHHVSDVMAFYPSRLPEPPFGPWLLVAFAHDRFGGPHVYRPVSD